MFHKTTNAHAYEPHPQQRPFCYRSLMKANARTLELTETDLLGFVSDALECNQCGGAFCGMRVGRVYKGKPLIMCSRKPEVKEILATLKPR